MSDPIVVTVLDRALAAGTPLLLGTLGEIVAERSGILNLGVEGMMSVGAVTGFMTAVATGSPWLGMLAAVAAGAAVSLLHAFASITLRANQVVSGLALAMLGVGLSGLLGKPYIGVAAAEANLAQAKANMHLDSMSRNSQIINAMAMIPEAVTIFMQDDEKLSKVQVGGQAEVRYRVKDGKNVGIWLHNPADEGCS